MSKEIKLTDAARMAIRSGMFSVEKGEEELRDCIVQAVRVMGGMELMITGALERAEADEGQDRPNLAILWANAQEMRECAVRLKDAHNMVQERRKLHDLYRREITES